MREIATMSGAVVLKREGKMENYLFYDRDEKNLGGYEDALKTVTDLNLADDVKVIVVFDRDHRGSVYLSEGTEKDGADLDEIWGRGSGDDPVFETLEGNEAWPTLFATGDASFDEAHVIYVTMAELKAGLAARP